MKRVFESNHKYSENHMVCIIKLLTDGILCSASRLLDKRHCSLSCFCNRTRQSSSTHLALKLKDCWSCHIHVHPFPIYLQITNMTRLITSAHFWAAIFWFPHHNVCLFLSSWDMFAPVILSSKDTRLHQSSCRLWTIDWCLYWRISPWSCSQIVNVCIALEMPTPCNIVYL